MSRYIQNMQTMPKQAPSKGQKWLLAACAVLLACTLALGGLCAYNGVFRRNTDKQFSQRMVNCVSDAIAEVNRLSSVVNTATVARLGVIRQYVYAMDQMNEMSLALHGRSGRLAPQEAFDALYSDLETLETLMQTATGSTLDARTLLLTHLSNLQMLLTQAEQ